MPKSSRVHEPLPTSPPKATRTKPSFEEAMRWVGRTPRKGEIRPAEHRPYYGYHEKPKSEEYRNNYDEIDWGDES